MKQNMKAVKKINLSFLNTYKKSISIFLSCLIVLFGTFTTPGLNIFGDHNNSRVLAYVYDGEYHDAPPAKDAGYVIDEITCDKAKGAWNNDTWEIVIYEMEGNFTCNLKFKLLHPYHSLTIDPNGGTYDESPGPQEYNIQETYTYDVLEPTRKGHSFTGWEVTGRESKIENNVFTMGKEDSTLKAKWQINSYAVEIRDSVQCDGLVTAEYNSRVELCTPTKRGYTFAGWQVSSGTIDGSDFIVDDSDAIITARWQINNYDYITYHMQKSIGGDYVLKDVDTASAQYNTEVTPEVRTYTGFTSPQSKTILITTEDNEINYQYTRNRYTLTITPGTGVTYSGQTSMQLYFEETTELAIPVKTGYNFKGWDKTSGEVTDNIFKMGASNATLTPKWEPKKFTVTFNGNGGSITQTTKEVTYDSTYGTLPTGVRTGYEFLGWYTDPTTGTKVNATDIVKITSNQTLYAHWKLIVFNITFNPNGGTVSPTSKQVTYSQTYGTLPTPTRTGYTFDGWFTSSSGGSQVTSSTTVTITSDQTLYAHWTIKSYAVAINVGTGVSRSASSINVTYGSNNTVTITPSDGYYLSSASCTNGYTTNADTGTSATTSQIVRIYNNNKDSTSTCTFNASGRTFTVDFDKNRGNTPSFTSKSVTYKSTYGNLPTVTRNASDWEKGSSCYRDVYTFDGWYTSKSGGSKITSSSTVNNAYDHTLYAHWDSDEERKDFHYSRYEFTFVFTLYVNGDADHTTTCKLNISCNESRCTSSGMTAESGYQSDCDDIQSDKVVSNYKTKVYNNRNQSCVPIFTDSTETCVSGYDAYCDY